MALIFLSSALTAEPQDFQNLRLSRKRKGKVYLQVHQKSTRAKYNNEDNEISYFSVATPQTRNVHLRGFQQQQSDKKERDVSEEKLIELVAIVWLKASPSAAATCESKLRGRKEQGTIKEDKEQGV